MFVLNPAGNMCAYKGGLMYSEARKFTLRKYNEFERPCTGPLRWWPFSVLEAGLLQPST
jgi:hypothetical protein